MATLRSILAYALLILTGATISGVGQTDDVRGEQQAAAAVTPAYCSSIHNVGRLTMPVTNAGYFGHGH